MGKVEVLTGNYAAAWGARLSRVEVVAAYPITPQTQVIEKLAEFVEKGELKAKFIRVESEHSAMAACIGASAVGARAFTATSSHGLLLMHEMCWWAAGARLPIVMTIVARAIAPPWTIWNEHSDIMDERDTGWLIMFAENNQETLDGVIQAFRIAEDERVLLPVMVNEDAFILSHTAMPVDIPDQEVIDEFLPPRTTKPFILDPDNPFTHGNLTYPDHYMEFRYMMHQAMERAKEVIREVDEKYYKLVGRRYGGLFENYRCNDADVIIVAAGSSAGDAKEAADKLRDEGYKVGVFRVRFLRPFPEKEVREILGNAKGVVIVDRDFSFGKGGILCTEIASALYGINKPPVLRGFITGLGGRDITVNDFKQMTLKTFEAIEKGDYMPKQEWFKAKLEVIP